MSRMTEYKKAFDKWAKVAREIETRGRRDSIKVGAVYWCSLGVNVGSIVDGKGENFTRPALVISASEGGQALIIPVTSHYKAGPNTQQVIICGKYEWLLFAQARPVDLRCLGDFIDELDHIALLQVKKNYLKYLKIMFYKK